MLSVLPEREPVTYNMSKLICTHRVCMFDVYDNRHMKLSVSVMRPPTQI